MPDLTAFASTVVTIGTPMLLGGAVALVRRVHQNSTAIAVLEMKQAASDKMSEDRHKETREDLMEIKQVVRDVQKHLLQRP